MQVAFAPLGTASTLSAVPQCFFCTAEGTLACTVEDGSRSQAAINAARVLHEEPCAALRDMDVVAGQGVLEVVTGSDQEHILWGQLTEL